MSRTAIFLLPIYDEEARLEVLLDRIRDAPLPDGWARSILAVDDGSRDRSAAILARRAADLPLVRITHPVNLGLPPTLADGFVWVAHNGGDGDVVVTMDADDTHDPNDAAPMLTAIDDGYDLVLASRFVAGAAMYGVAAHRHVYGNIANGILRATLALPGVTDYGCGFRAARASLVRDTVAHFGERLLELRSWGFICTAEMLWKLSWASPRIAEVPLILRYDQKESRSKMPSLRTISGYGVLAAKGVKQRLFGA